MKISLMLVYQLKHANLKIKSINASTDNQNAQQEKQKAVQFLYVDNSSIDCIVVSAFASLIVKFAPLTNPCCCVVCCHMTPAS